MAAYQFKSVLLANTAVAVGASASNTPVSEVFRPAVVDALNGVIAVTSTGVTSTTGITAKLQQSADGSTYTDVTGVSATITAAGISRLSWNVQDTAQQAALPLLPYLRVVVTTGLGDAVTVSEVRFFTRG